MNNTHSKQRSLVFAIYFIFMVMVIMVVCMICTTINVRTILSTVEVNNEILFELKNTLKAIESTVYTAAQANNIQTPDQLSDDNGNIIFEDAD